MAEQTERKRLKQDGGRVGREFFFSFIMFVFSFLAGGVKSCLPPRRGASHSSLCLAFLP